VEKKKPTRKSKEFRSGGDAERFTSTGEKTNNCPQSTGGKHRPNGEKKWTSGGHYKRSGKRRKDLLTSRRHKKKGAKAHPAAQPRGAHYPAGKTNIRGG